ncbi:MAG: cytochrome c [Chitinophagales bacterium]
MNRTIIFSTVFALIFALWSCGESTPPKENNSTPVKEVAETSNTEGNNAELGKKVYSQFCVACHGADGKLGINGAGDLTASALPEAEVITRIQKGKGLMTPYEEILSEAQINAVAAYVIAMRAK